MPVAAAVEVEAGLNEMVVALLLLLQATTAAVAAAEAFCRWNSRFLFVPVAMASDEMETACYERRRRRRRDEARLASSATATTMNSTMTTTTRMTKRVSLVGALFSW